MLRLMGPPRRPRLGLYTRVVGIRCPVFLENACWAGCGGCCGRGLLGPNDTGFGTEKRGGYRGRYTPRL